MSDIMGMGGMDPETALAMDMMMGASMPPGGEPMDAGVKAPCTVCGAMVDVNSGAPVEGAAPGMDAAGAALPPMDGMGAGGIPPMM